MSDFKESNEYLDTLIKNYNLTIEEQIAIRMAGKEVNTALANATLVACTIFPNIREGIVMRVALAMTLKVYEETVKNLGKEGE